MRVMTAPRESSTRPIAAPGGDREDLESAFSLLVRMTRDVAMSADIVSTLGDALAIMGEHLGTRGGSVWLLDEAGTEFECKAAIGTHTLVGMCVPFDAGIIGRSVRTQEVQVVIDVSKDPDFAAAVDEHSGIKIESVICSPLIFSGEALGAIVLADKMEGPDNQFAAKDVELLEALTASAALAVANARFARSRIEHDRVQTELETAAAIQRNLLPSRRPQPYPVVGCNIAARTVSGDLYDILPLEDGRIAFCLGDVSGKSMNASLLMAKTASLYRVLAKREENPGRLLAALNEELVETTTRGMFVTMVAGLYDPTAGTIILANAGHEPVLVQEVDGTFSSLPADGPPLGILEETTFPERALLIRNTRVYLYSDGLTEAMRASGEALGSAGVQELISKRPIESPDRRVDGLLADIKRLEHRDDLTLLVIDDTCWDRDAGEAVNGLLLNHRIVARAEKLAEMRAVLRDCLESAGCSPGSNGDIVLAIDEACQNVIRHAYQGECDSPIELTVEREGECLVFRLFDEAPTADPDKIRPRELDSVRPGGLGVHFIRNVMDETDYLRSPRGEGNLLRMTRRLD